MYTYTAPVLDPGFIVQTTATAQATTKEVTQVIQDYYHLVEQQEYPTAYTYFERGSDLLPFLTQECYIQTETNEDQVNGKVTAISIDQIATVSGLDNPGTIDPNMREATVQVTRLHKTQIFDMGFQRESEGDAWKIDSVHPYLC